MEDDFPIRDVYHLFSNQHSLRKEEKATHKHFACVRVLSMIIRLINATSPPGVINSFVLAVGAFPIRAQ
jgi:hypothetical protein